MARVPRAGAGSSGANTAAVAGVKRRLRALGARATKGLGQHFLIDRSVLGTIVGAADLSADDTVVEVGPGLGILTAELLQAGANVVAVEVDPRLASALRRTFSASKRLAIVNADVLDVNPPDLICAAGSHESGAGTYKVIANLPYYVAAAILRRFLEASVKPSMMVVMVQREVGESIAASPGDLSLLGVSVQVYGKPTLVAAIPPTAFYPEPKVDSAVVRIDVHEKPLVDENDAAGFFDLVKAGFSAPRKQLRNSLSIGLNVEAAEATAMLSEAGISPERRPGTVSIEEWMRVYHVFNARSRP